MRKLIYAINLSLDGVCDHTKMMANEEVHDYHTQLLRGVDVLLYGRKTYQLMVPFWPDVAKTNPGPKSINDFAHAFESVSRIVVFSKSLDKVEGNKTTIFRGNLREEIVKLKQENGKDIIVGGVDLASQLIELGLVDEFHFVVQPVIVGEGRKLEGISLPKNLQLKLEETKTFKSGCVALRLHPAA
jgi:dihydrofolate reductase